MPRKTTSRGTPSAAATAPDSSVGQRLRRIRRDSNLSLKTLAELAEVSVGMISQIERDQANPSIRMLEKLRTALHVPLSALLEDDAPAAAPRRNAAPEFVRRADQRPKFRVGPHGLLKELLSPPGEHDLQFMIILIPPHSRSEEVLLGRGEKAGMVLEGTISLVLADQEAILNEGDSFQFSSAVPHGVSNPTGKDARLLWIMNTERPVIHL
ncbi:helix-turn-helix domain-containing protein [Achromobacter aloeverae]|uniref:HTH cro/C1-type domain-containing protein n=1 Tax=Achromobacter aloeverae TaxID=1750518 RepID=A0A4Q1HRI0_9BURK|nr:cupin domain-containing protein [Achromobacter aloeverae]RXN93427.1 hypothetical protein C7R54_01020 [Achromobacter aloeverae]